MSPVKCEMFIRQLGGAVPGGAVPGALGYEGCLGKRSLWGSSAQLEVLSQVAGECENRGDEGEKRRAQG